MKQKSPVVQPISAVAVESARARAPRGIVMRLTVLVSLGVAAFVALSAVALVSSSPGGAEAFAVYPSGNPGQVTVPFTQGVSNLLIGNVIYSGNRLVFPDRSAYRSGSYSSYAQDVCMSVRVWTKRPYDPSNAWALQENLDRGCVRTSPGQYAPFHAFNVSGVVPDFVYTVDVVFTWKLTNGSIIGSKTVAYDQPTDYQCLDTSCSRLNEYVWGLGWRGGMMFR